MRAESAPAEKPGSPDEDQPQQEGEKQQDEEGQAGSTVAPSDQKTDDSEPQGSLASGAADSQKDAQEVRKGGACLGQMSASDLVKVAPCSVLSYTLMAPTPKLLTILCRKFWNYVLGFPSLSVCYM